MTSWSLWNYYRDQLEDDSNQINADYYWNDSSKSVTIDSFENKAKIIVRPADNNTLDTTVAAPLKYLNNIWDLLIRV